MPPVLTAIGGALAGAVANKVVGAAAGAVFGGGGGGSSGGSSGPFGPTEAPSTTVANLKTLKGDKVTLTGGVKVAKTANIPSISYPYYGDEKDNPWKNTQDWYTTLGGDPENVKDLNPENMPF